MCVGGIMVTETAWVCTKCSIGCRFIGEKPTKCMSPMAKFEWVDEGDTDWFGQVVE